MTVLYILVVFILYFKQTKRVVMNRPADSQDDFYKPLKTTSVVEVVRTLHLLPFLFLWTIVIYGFFDLFLWVCHDCPRVVSEAENIFMVIPHVDVHVNDELPRTCHPCYSTVAARSVLWVLIKA